jgi:hypothetical protein
MAGFMVLKVWGERYADFAPLSGGHAETLPVSIGEANASELQRVSDVSEREGWFARYTAPGYMDQTDLTGPHESAIDAAIECFRTFGDDSEDSDDSKELDSIVDEIKRSHGLGECQNPSATEGRHFVGCGCKEGN